MGIDLAPVIWPWVHAERAMSSNGFEYVRTFEWTCSFDMNQTELYVHIEWTCSFHLNWTGSMFEHRFMRSFSTKYTVYTAESCSCSCSSPKSQVLDILQYTTTQYSRVRRHSWHNSKKNLYAHKRRVEIPWINISLLLSFLAIHGWELHCMAQWSREKTWKWDFLVVLLARI